VSEERDTTPPYRIETERLVIRCWEPRDAPLLKEAVDASIDHLRPWMPWAHREPQSVAEKVQLLRRFRGLFDLGDEFVYGIFSADERAVVGGTGLHRRVGDDAFEIGYWIHVDRAGRGLATESTAALTRVGFALCGADRIEIRAEPRNAASRRVPQKLGYTEEGTLRRRVESVEPGGPRRDVVLFSLLAEEFAASPLASFPLHAYDVVGERLL
jgi:RimJ/RimL family protein N-acetyltransferase